MIHRILGVVLLIFLVTESRPADRLPRKNLLLYRGPTGKIEQGSTVAHWEQRRQEVLAGMQSVMGKLPGKEKRVALEVKVEEEIDCGSFVRRLITYQSEPGSRTPAYLCIPKSALKDGKKAAAVLCLHPTDNKIGHKVVVGLGGRANRQYAQELAERGFITLAPAYTMLANYWPDLKKLGHTSGTMKAVWDNIRGLDYLETLPFVDTSRGFGTIGHSL
ncbi:MAG: alpha/beta hydrolase, partial [Limisphaerales bacterium]